MQGKDIIFFSSDDWGWKTSKYQLSTRFARDNRVLFVSSIGFRAPTASASDLSRIANKLKSFAKGLRKVEDNLHVLTPLAVPFNIPFKQQANRLLLRAQLAFAMRQLGMQNPYVFVFSQNWYPLVRNVSRQHLAYYCVDEHSGFSGIDQDSFRELDVKMNQLADSTICSAHALFERKREHNPNSHYLPHGVNFDLFASTQRDPKLQAAPLYDQLPENRILFFGHISHDWVDAELVRQMADARPDWAFVFVGRNAMDDKEFAEQKNIHLVGERPFEELPSWCKGATVGIIPFVKSELTDNCNPLKLYEYLAAGLPVVSTDIPEVRQFGGEIGIASDAAGFVAALETAIASRSAENDAARTAMMESNSWEARVQTIYGIINGELQAAA